ncbi:response regulator transcription factor [Streptomyces sp. VNUA116]|uniref:response regulator transcription factor n=1 Tax=Streptomyces sp. VNUA116 TaxID=3062449 RepID=UPI0026757B9C|nr:response regulator transcription factor [Streptomyces sp. VNUA116]WKU44937.1 response regulator transcription factor [Streptomyces sp. VNUA116]
MNQQATTTSLDPHIRRTPPAPRVPRPRSGSGSAGPAGPAGAAGQGARTRRAEAVRAEDTLRVLVVESDARAAETLVHGLRRHGYDTAVAGTGSKALEAYADTDLVLLDLELPDLDGLEICRAIRAASDIPVIAVTARASELDRVLGLQAGADDYVVKPYGFRELMARIEAVMRRARPRGRDRSAALVITAGPLTIDAGTREVRLGGRRVEVTRKEFDLLRLLASQPEKVISRKELMTQVWDDNWSRPGRTIDTHVSSLRGKLGSADWIITIRGVGFRFGHLGNTDRNSPENASEARLGTALTNA